MDELNQDDAARLLAEAMEQAQAELDARAALLDKRTEFINAQEVKAKEHPMLRQARLCGADQETYSEFSDLIGACPTNPLEIVTQCSRIGQTTHAEVLTMAYNLLLCDREQDYLMPPSLREWLVEGDLAWFIVDAVEQVELRDVRLCLKRGFSWS